LTTFSVSACFNAFRAGLRCHTHSVRKPDSVAHPCVLCHRANTSMPNS
jgi:hypothetical protein